MGLELLPYAETVAALGRSAGGDLDYADDVPLTNIVGTVGRATDFDGEFRVLSPVLRRRRESIDQLPSELITRQRIELTRLGELYFVRDGHHRVAVAKARGWHDIPARVRWLCTTAYGLACLRLQDLAAKAAERTFLERVPLADDLRPDLWLDRPADWMRLADAAEAWGFRRLRTGGPPDPDQLARRWWDEEVQPLVARLRRAGIGIGLADIQLFAAALAVRDRRGSNG